MSTDNAVRQGAINGKFTSQYERSYLGGMKPAHVTLPSIIFESSIMDNAILNSELIAIQAETLSFITMMVVIGNIFLHQLISCCWRWYSGKFLFGCSRLTKAGYAILRSEDLSSWEYVPVIVAKLSIALTLGIPKKSRCG